MISSRIIIRYVKRFVYLIPLFWFLFFLASFYFDDLHHSDTDSILPNKQRNVVKSKADLQAALENGIKVIPPVNKDNVINARDNPAERKDIEFDKKLKVTAPHVKGQNENVVNVNGNLVKEPNVDRGNIVDIDMDNADNKGQDKAEDDDDDDYDDENKLVIAPPIHADDEPVDPNAPGNHVSFYSLVE